MLLSSMPLSYSDSISDKNNRYDTIIIFGDSNSDDGNVFNMTAGIFPPSPNPYFQGRFSNGYVWCERLNVAMTINKAHGGATTDDDFIQSITTSSHFQPPGVRQQIANYSRSMNKTKINLHRTLYVIWAGGNDFLQNNSLSPSSIIGSLVNATKYLLSFGIKNLILVNQPPLQSIPFLQSLENYTNLSDLTHQYNTKLFQSIQILQHDYVEINIRLFDLNSLISKIFLNSTPYGLSELINPCWSSASPTSLCLNPDTYVFFDEVHFTRRIHQLIAEDFQRFLRSSSTEKISLLFLHYLIICVFFSIFSH